MDVVEFSSADRRENRLKYVHIRRRRSYFGPSKRRPVHIRNSNRFCQRVFADAFTIISKIVRARLYFVGYLACVLFDVRHVKRLKLVTAKYMPYPYNTRT